MPQRIFETVLNPEALKGKSKARPLMSLMEDVYAPLDWKVTSKPGALKCYIMQTSRSLINWFRLQHFVSIGHADLLGEEQRNSYQLLFDWWTATSDRPSTPLLYCSQLQFLVHQNPRLKRFTDRYKELWICIQSNLSETLSDMQSREAYYRQASFNCSQISHRSSDIRHGSLILCLQAEMGLGSHTNVPGFVQSKRPIHIPSKHLTMALVSQRAHGSRTGMKIPLDLVDGPSICGI